MSAHDHPDDPTLDAYLDRALDPPAASAVAAHLARCPECAARAGRLAGILGALAALPDEAPDRDLAPGVLAALSPGAARPQPRLVARPAAALFAAEALLALALLVLAWPLIGASPAAGGVLELAAQLQASGAQLGAALSAEWLALASSFAGWTNGLGGASDLLAALALPGAGPLPAVCLAAGALLWLLGNSLLLDPAGRSRTRGTHQP